MRSTDALASLLRLESGYFSTNDVAAQLKLSSAHASQVLKRLAQAGHFLRLGRGRWAKPGLSPFALPEALTAPKPSYVSLQSALYHHGLIEQIPTIIYAATLAPTRRVTTPLGEVSLHQLAPAFFSGFELAPKEGIKIATAEKALVDFLYLRPARSLLFRALPEVELPRGFSRKRAQSFTSLIASASRREMVQRQLKMFF